MIVRWQTALLGALMNIAIGVSAVGAQSNVTAWSKPIDMTQPSGNQYGAFPLLLCDKYNNMHLLFGSLPTTQRFSEIYYRTDTDGAWSAPVDVLAMPERVAIRLDGAISDKTDTLHLIWINAYINGELRYSQAPLARADDPWAWSVPITLASQISNANNTGNATIAVDPAGTVHIVYGTYDETGTQLSVQHIKSIDDGQTWSAPIMVYSSSASVPSDIGAWLAIDGRGRLHVAITTRTQEYGLASELGYIRSSDGGQTWSEYRKISDTSTSFQGLSTLAVYAFGDNEIHLTWHDPRRLHQWSTDGGQTWRDPVRMIDLGAAFGGPNALAKDSAGILHAVAATGGGVFSTGFDGLQWGLPELIDERFIDPHGQDIVVCQGNELHVAYYDRTGDKSVWYATKSVNAPHRDQQRVLVPTPAAVATRVISEPTATPPSKVTSLSNAPEYFQTQPFQPIVVAIVPVLILLGAVIVFRRRQLKS